MFGKDSNIVSMSPSEVLGAGIDQLPRHFSGLDANQRERFIKEMEIEDDLLRPLIEKSRLDDWYKTTLSQAKKDFEKDLQEKTDDGKNMIEAAVRLEDIEKSIKENVKADAYRRLHNKPEYQRRKKPNGNVGKFRSSVQQF
jgi:hypothetical protein